MNVDGQEVKTEFYLGDDYKFILLMLGLKGQHPIMLVPSEKHTKMIAEESTMTTQVTILPPQQEH